MKKNLNNLEQENKLINSKFIHNSISVLLAISPILGGFYLLWGFLLFIGRPDIFQAIISDTVAPIIISIAFLIYIFALIFILYLPSIVFYLYFYIYRITNKKITGLSINKLIRLNFFSSLLFIASITITSFLSFWEKIKIPSSIILILFILYLIVLFFYYKKDESIIIVGVSSLTCSTPFLLILNFMTGGESILSLIIFSVLCLALLLIQNVTLYCIFTIPYKEHLLSISCTAIILVTFLYSSYTNIFYKAYQNFYIIDKNEYDLIINKNDYSMDVFSDNAWLIEQPSEDKNVYHVKGERLFNLSKTVLFCPQKTYEDLKNSALYNMDTLKVTTSRKQLKDKVNKCVLLDASKVTFHKLLPENKSEQ